MITVEIAAIRMHKCKDAIVGVFHPDFKALSMMCLTSSETITFSKYSVMGFPKRV